jgi:nucleoside-diphosphate-sugar epimerase
MQGVEVVFHQGALASVPRSIADPITSLETNINGTQNILLAARDAGVRRVVHVSSSSVYGDTPTLPKHEGMPTKPVSPYKGWCTSCQKWHEAPVNFSEQVLGQGHIACDWLV